MAKGGDHRANRATKTGQEAADQTSNVRRELDQESTNTLASNGKKTLSLGTKAGEEVTNGAGGGNNAANGRTKAGDETADQAGDLRAQLDKQLLGVGADDGQDIVDLGSKVLDEVAVEETAERTTSRGG